LVPPNTILIGTEQFLSIRSLARCGDEAAGSVRSQRGMVPPSFRQSRLVLKMNLKLSRICDGLPVPKGNDQRDDHRRSRGGECCTFVLLFDVSTNAVPLTPVRLLSYTGHHYELTPGLTANPYDPLSSPIREGLEVGGDGDECMPPEIVRQILRSGLRLQPPVGWWSLDVMALMDGIDTRQCVTQYVKRVSWLV
jgi:hypothetical protein